MVQHDSASVHNVIQFGEVLVDKIECLALLSPDLSGTKHTNRLN